MNSTQLLILQKIIVNMKKYFIIALSLLSTVSIFAQSNANDSIQETRRSNQNVMLNASSATAPHTVVGGNPSKFIK